MSRFPKYFALTIRLVIQILVCSHTDETNLTNCMVLMLAALVTTILWLGGLDYLHESCGIVRCCGGMFIQVNMLLMTLYKWCILIVFVIHYH